ncbi:prevent-host-death protein [Hoeflea sp. BAL378]|uniref:type II toxin-antitoxin system Phd/YefM family antitoxin n=1 Tax=Hoeflea sp. BAL378 TaxID=1547437 RepID=UPI000512A13D|nr:type II toxin-antitoxin system Phd/YefM family antitoxin [Hoeflea sp. BAL378]KGF68151.1 prevent-host-death protein [Hoeflea sp. BAL378]
MSSVGVKEAKAGLSGLVDEAASGAFVTITRHGKPAAVLVSIEAAEAAKRELGKDRPSLVAHLKRFPADIDLDDEAFARNRTPSREFDL